MTGTIVAPPAERTPAPPEPPRGETAMRLVALVAGTAVAVGLLAATAGWPWVIVIGSIIVIIMLHELGHFATAKWSGMKATEFFVGFGPRLWSIRKGETEYGFKAIPLGGYVKILGMTSAEELDPSDEPRSFINQSTSKRVLVASAGSIMHLLIALLLAIGALWFIGNPHANRVQIGALSIIPGVVTPAERAGLKSGDLLVSIDGVSTTGQNVISQIQSGGSHPLRIVVLRGGRDVTVLAQPKPLDAHSSVPKLGVFLSDPVTYTHPGLIGSVTAGTALVWRVTTGTVHAFTQTFSPKGLTSLATQVTNAKDAARVRATGQGGSVSMVGATELAVDAVKAGPLAFIEILIALNISLGVLNMLPMLPLDGGHVAIALYERARTRKGKPRYRADVNKLMPVVYAFMAFLLIFVASKMYLDIAHGVSNPFG